MKPSSFIPYLDHQQGVHLMFPQAPEGSENPRERVFPFSLLDDSDPLCRLVEGVFTTDASGLVRKVFVLIQRDQYRFPHDPLLSITNPDVEETWQKAVTFYRSCGHGTGTISLSAQHDADSGRAVPFGSLFACTERRLFFHPVCPRCKTPLELCTDDERLSGRGLPPYSRSLQRYLVCPSDTCEKKSIFYTLERSISDPPDVMGCDGLIQEYLLMAPEQNQRADVPCAACPERPGCLETARGGTARGQIVPFAFYPFHAVIFESSSLNALDFASLLSGASPDEIVGTLREKGGEYGRVLLIEALAHDLMKGFFFQGTDKFFAEVLYLKLTLLAGIIRLTPDEEFSVRPGSTLSPDKIWINLGQQNSLLPSFWTFTARRVDLYGSFSPPRPLAGIIKNPSPYLLALTWFHILLANKHQSLNDIAGAVEEYFEDAAPLDSLSDQLQDLSFSHRAFLPVNIFWNQPRDRAMNLEALYLIFWEKALSLGKSLLQAAAAGKNTWTKEAFLGSLDHLRTQVFDSVFSTRPVAASSAPEIELKPDPRVIGDILAGIIAKWRLAASADTEKSKETAAADMADTTPVKQTDESVETIILGASPGISPAAPTAAGTDRKPEAGAADLAQTVILSSQPRTKTPPVASPEAAPAEDSLAQTVILGPERTPSGGAGNKTLPAEQAPKRNEDDLEATVIIGSNRTPPGVPGAPATEQPKKPLEDDLEATVIISRSDKNRPTGR